jgi:nickel/cobalt transporter (NicO) family protein
MGIWIGRSQQLANAKFMRIRFWLQVLAFLVIFAPLSVSYAQSTTTPPSTQQNPSSTQQNPAPRSFLPGKAATGPAVVAPPAGPIDRLYSWITVQQQAINRALANAVKQLKAGGGLTAALTLGALSFMYGVLHAAGPGHGKAVISAYVLADRQTLNRGVMLSFLSAFVQALMALLVVAVLKFILDASGMQATKLTEAWLERASWAFVTLFGAWLLYRQFSAYRAASAHGISTPARHGHSHTHEHGAHAGHSHAGHAHEGHAHAAHAKSGHSHAKHGHDHHDHKHHDHGHGEVAEHSHSHSHSHTGHSHSGHNHAAGEACDTCGHAHMPSPDALQKDWSLARMLTLAFAIGIRPCTGAILVLVFAISQGLLWAGVFATFAMAIGTAITVSTLAALAVGSRGFAERYAARSGAGWLTRLQPIVSTSAATLMMVLGATFFYYSLVTPSTF